MTEQHQEPEVANEDASSKSEAQAAAPTAKKQKNRLIGTITLPWLLTICAVLALGGAFVTIYGANRGIQRDAGATVSNYQNMTRDEIQAELDKTVRDNMMTVSVAARATMDDQGIVRINAINDTSNKFSQRYSLIQDEQVIYESGAVDPGSAIESCRAKNVHAGEAFIEVQAVDTETLKDHGNPTRVKIDIIES